jgi:mannitol-1-phosphate/altronate dehydrogenase
MRHVRGRAEDGSAIVLDDPLAAELQRAIGKGASGRALVRSLAATDAIFGADLGTEPRFLAAVEQALEALDRLGTRGFLAQGRA